MKQHQLWAGARLPAEYQRAFSDPRRYLGAGEFACAAVVDSERVVKLTSCRASMRYLSELAVRTPLEGQPQVYDLLGCVGQQAATQAPVMGFVMERLYTADTLTATREGVGPRGGALVAQDAATARARLSELRALVSDIYVAKFGICEDVCNTPDFQDNLRLGDLVIAKLRGTCLAALRPALGQIVNRQKAGNWTLDMGHQLRENVLLSVWGEPILADPVWSPKQQEPSLGHPVTTKGHWLASKAESHSQSR